MEHAPKACCRNGARLCLEDQSQSGKNGGRLERLNTDCECLVVSNEHVTSATNSLGKLNYSLDLKNNTGVPVKYLFLVPNSSCFTFMPGILTYNPPLSPNQTVTVSAMINVAGSCPTNLCFTIAAHDSNR